MRPAGAFIYLLLLPLIAAQNETETPASDTPAPVELRACRENYDSNILVSSTGRTCQSDNDCVGQVETICCDYESQGQNVCVQYENKTPDGPPPELATTTITTADDATETTTGLTLPVPITPTVAPALPLTLPEVSTSPSAGTPTVSPSPPPSPTSLSLALPTTTLQTSSFGNCGGSCAPPSIVTPTSSQAPSESMPPSFAVPSNSIIPGNPNNNPGPTSAQVGVGENAPSSSPQNPRVGAENTPAASIGQNEASIIPATEETLIQTVGGITLTSISGGTPLTLTQPDGRVITSTSGGLTLVSISGGTLSTAVVTRSARTIARIAATSSAAVGSAGRERGEGGRGERWRAVLVGGLTVVPFLVGFVGL